LFGGSQKGIRGFILSFFLYSIPWCITSCYSGLIQELNFHFSDKAMDDEMMKIIETTVPFAVPATIMLMIYVVFSNWSTDKRQSKPLEMYLGVWSVILALICTFGIFFFLGIAFNPVTSTMPFLVLAVGIDDDFLMLAAWRELDFRIPLHQKVALVMADAGASITVTSFTNFFCFGLGYYMCSTPAVADFCLITAWAVLIDYLMQITFFAAVLCYSGRKEETGGLSSCCYKNERSCFRRRLTKNSRVIVPYMHKFFGEKFAPFILRRDVRFVSWVFFVVYTCAALYGCCILKVDISPVKYIRDNSPIQTFVKLADKYIWADNVMPTFHVMNPPDLRDAGKRARLNELVYRLEHTNYSIGRVSTNFWMWQYQQYLNDFPDVDYQTDFYNKKYLRDFFNQIDYSQYRANVKFVSNVSDGEPCIAAFTFETSFYGLDSWDKRQEELFRWRGILDEYPDFDMFLANIFSPFLIDQRHTIAPSSMQTIGAALAMMALISFFFLPDAQSVFLMTWSLLSISMGVCGGLALLGSDLDSVSMGCIVMAIGLAVDYSVHICYRYHRSECSKTAEKVKDTLCSVAWPITQAVSSTLFGLATTAFVPAYLVRVFFQTVYLVNIIGLTHALIWLPQLIAALDPCERVPLRLRLKKH
uniref:SSD domain-containing protein n=1 Tax=Heligmosomoides polygyrus TaxID=6339 RepID=A0A8L8KST3_HELPZ